MTIFKTAMKVFFLLIAISLIILSISFFTYSNRIYKRFDEALAENMIDLEVDLSKPGNYSSNFQYSYNYSHGISVGLQMSVEDINTISKEQLLDELDYDCEMKIDHNELMLEKTDSKDSNDWMFWGVYRAESQGDFIVLAYAECSHVEGEAELNLKVNKGYPELSGKKQKLVAKYAICGCEKLAASFAIIMGIFLLLIAIAILLILWKVSKTKKPSNEIIEK